MINQERNRRADDKFRQIVRQLHKGNRPDLSQLSNEELKDLLYEFETFQVGLLNQNKDLQNAYQELEQTKNRLQQLYDMTPVGYCTLNNRGVILEANLPFCKMINEDRDLLPGKNLDLFLARESSSQFYQHLEQTRLSSAKQICHLELNPTESGCRFIQMESMPDCGLSGEIILRSACSDITNWKMVEEENVKHLKPQSALNRLLSLSMEKISLEESLNEFLRHIVYLPWLGLNPAGAVFLLNENREVLELKAQLGMPQEILENCREVKMGHCYCGQAAAEGRLIYTRIPEKIWLKTENPSAAPSHIYCIPIGSPRSSTTGVYLLYLKEHQKRNAIVEETLLAAARVIGSVIEHKKTEEELKKSYDHLEERVKERTAELEEKNIALKVLLEQRARDRKDLENQMVTNIKKIIIPYLKKLQNSRLNQEQSHLLNLIEKQLEEITSPLIPTLSSKYLKMTPTELQICHLISQGHNSKEIASVMNLSPETVNKHRQNIREKFGLCHKKVNLSTYLATLSESESDHP